MNVIPGWLALGLITVVGSVVFYKMMSMVFALGISALYAALHLHGLH